MSWQVSAICRVVWKIFSNDRLGYVGPMHTPNPICRWRICKLRTRIVRIHMSVGRETAADRPASDERRRRTVGKRYWYGWNTGGVRRETDEMSRPTVPHRMGNVRKRPGNVRNTDVLRWETEELRMDC